MIKINNLKKLYGERTVLDIPLLEIKSGECVVLTGHNGSGKSTLLKILAGTVKENEGKAISEGKIYYLPQQSIPFNKSVKANILFCLDGKRKIKRELCDDVLNAFELKQFENKSAKTLSGGECQRLALARVLCRKGDIILLDEPSSAADNKGRALINELIKQYCEKTGCTLIMTTHTGEFPKISNLRIIELCDGKIKKDSMTGEINDA
ncbi:MAG: energy-coupling factor ABC transporter ATP-binding protein [Clostridia bacterium]|nr:energy-coupling factor ABC transporter ATP-binding protein [Clostridia bacterium]